MVIIEKSPDAQTVRAILRDKERFPLMTHDEFVAAWNRWNEWKDPRDFDVLVQANLRLAFKLARRASLKYGLEITDAYQVSCIGLVQSIRKYDPGTGFKLSTYAWRAIKWAAEAEINESRVVKMHGQARRKVATFSQAMEDFKAVAGRSPTTLEIAEILGWRERDVEVVERIAMMAKIGSLDAPVPGAEDEDGGLLVDSITGPSLSSTYLPPELLEQLEIMTRGLKEKEIILFMNRVIAAVVGKEPLSLPQLAQKHGGSKQLWHQLEVRLMPRLKARYIEHFGHPNQMVRPRPS